MDSLSNENNEDPHIIGQDNPYFIAVGENGAGDADDLNLELFEMDGDGEGTSSSAGGDQLSSTLPRMSDHALPELPTNTTRRFSTFPKAGAAAELSSATGDKDHIYDSIKQPPAALGESQEIDNEPFTRV